MVLNQWECSFSLIFEGMCNVIVTQGKLFLKFFVVFESKLAMGTLRTMYCVLEYI